MAKVKFAFVEFLIDAERIRVPIEAIKNFSPRDTGDFNANRLYDVIWPWTGNTKSDENSSSCHQANILSLADKKEDIDSNKRGSKRLKGPISPLKENESACANEVQISIAKVEPCFVVIEPLKQRERTNSDTSEGSVPRELASLPESDEDDVVPMKLWSKLHKKMKILKKKHKDEISSLEEKIRFLMMENKKLESEKETYQKLNKEIQQNIMEKMNNLSDTLCQVSSIQNVNPEAERCETKPIGELDGQADSIWLNIPICKEEETDNRDLYSSIEGSSTQGSPPALPNGTNAYENALMEEEQVKVDLGEGILVDALMLKHITRYSTNSRFVKELAFMIWGDELKNRAVSGRNKLVRGRRLNRRPLSPAKLDVVKDLFSKRLEERGYDNEGVCKQVAFANNYICEKISDMRRSNRKRTVKRSRGGRCRIPERAQASRCPVRHPKRVLMKKNSDKIDLGGGIFVNALKLRTIKEHSKHSLFVKHLALLIWGNDLVDSNFTGRVRNPTVEDGSRKTLSTHKLDIIKELFHQRLVERGIKGEQLTSELSHLKHYISEKIADMRKTAYKMNSHCSQEEKTAAED